MKEKTVFSKSDTKMIKGAAILMMLFHHQFGFPGTIVSLPSAMKFNFDAMPLIKQMALFCKLCVMMYVFLGGYGSYKSCAGNSNNQLHLLLKKLFALYSKYWFVILVVLPISFLLKTDVFSSASLFKVLLGVSHIYCSEWWFFFPYIITLITFYGIYYLLKHTKKKSCDSRIKCAAELISVVLFAEIYLHSYPDRMPDSILANKLVSVYLSGIQLLPCFLLGAVFAKYHFLDIIKQFSIKNKTISVLLSVILIGSVFYLRSNDPLPHDYAYAAIFICSLIPLTICVRGGVNKKVLQNVFCFFKERTAPPCG